MNLPATVPGWTRFSVAEEMLQRLAKKDQTSQQALKRDFATFLDQSGSDARRLTDAERENLFRNFMLWRQAHTNENH